jgi:hypothetical protein
LVMKTGVKWLAVVLSVSVMLAGCGAQTASQYVKENYELVSAEGQGNTMQKVYRVAGQSVPAVAEEIAKQDKPQEMSKQDEEHMFLVYNDDIIHVQRDPEQPEDVLVETNTKEYVAQHYDPNFLEMFLTAALISSMFGSSWKSKSYKGYYGYGDYKYRQKFPNYTYPGQYKPPSGATVPPAGTAPGSGSSSGAAVTPPKSSSGTGKVVPKDGGSTSGSNGFKPPSSSKKKR